MVPTCAGALVSLKALSKRNAHQHANLGYADSKAATNSGFRIGASPKTRSLDLCNSVALLTAPSGLDVHTPFSDDLNLKRSTSRCSLSLTKHKMALADTLKELSWKQLILIVLVGYVISVYYSRISKWYRIRKLGGHTPIIQTWVFFGTIRDQLSPTG